jgi:nucleoside 2-deoxyribosyltransferase
MDFYIASKFESMDEVRKMQDEIRERGHSISADWTQHKNIPEYSKEEELAAEYASEDVEGAKDCDIFIILANEDSRGSHLELGAALASGSPEVFVIGEKREDCLFYFHDDVERRKKLEEVLKEV